MAKKACRARGLPALLAWSAAVWTVAVWPASASAQAPAGVKAPGELLPAGYRIMEEVRGDLNGDGAGDCVLIIKDTNKDNFVKDKMSDVEGALLDRNRRGMIIMFRKGKLYELALENRNCFSSEHEDGGVYMPPDLHVYIKKGNLYVHYGHGRYGYWRYTFKYRNSDFELIGYDASHNSGPIAQKVISVNFLSGKMQIKENINRDAEVEADEVFKETWKRLKSGKRIKLSEIKDFDSDELRLSNRLNEL